MSSSLNEHKEQARIMARQRKAIAETFYRWGYDEVSVPMINDHEIFTQKHSLPSWAVCKLIDGDGEIRALRPDMTSPLAQMAAVQWPEAPRPLRLCYFGEVFRRSRRFRGFTTLPQAGVELIGAPTTDADAEMVAVAAAALQEAGIGSFQINLGHNGLLREIACQLDMGENQARRLREALSSRNFVAARQIVKSCEHRTLTEPLLRILTPENSPDHMRLLNELRGSLSGLRRLQSIIEVLSDFGPADRVSIDVSLAGDFSYYTGVIFDIYSPRTGLRLGGGGRYDRLLRTYGQDEAATGFAFDLGSLRRSLPAGCGMRENEASWVVAGKKDSTDRMSRRAAQLRGDGNRAVVKAVSEICPDRLINWAKTRGHDMLEIIGASSQSENLRVSLSEEVDAHEGEQ